MTLDDVHTLLALCLSEMPARHPKPRLVVHESPESLVAFMGNAPHAFRHANAYPAALVMGMADAARNAIHIPYTTIVSEEKPVILDLLLHEIGHSAERRIMPNGCPPLESSRREARRPTVRCCGIVRAPLCMLGVRDLAPARVTAPMASSVPLPGKSGEAARRDSHDACAKGKTREQGPRLPQPNTRGAACDDDSQVVLVPVRRTGCGVGVLGREQGSRTAARTRRAPRVRGWEGWWTRRGRGFDEPPRKAQEGLGW